MRHLHAFCLFLLALLALPAAASAEENFGGDDESMEFASTAVSDEALDDIRGGAIQIGGLTIDYSYLAQLQTQLQGGSLETINLASYSTSAVSQLSSSAGVSATIQTIQAINNANISDSGAIVNLNQVIDIVISGLNQAQAEAMQNRVLTNALDSRRF